MVPALIILCSAFLTSPLTAQVSLSAIASADPVNVGDNFTLDIDIATGTQDINAVEIELSFDPTVFQILESSPGVFGTPGSTLPNSVGGVVVDNTNGLINYNASLLSAGATVNGSFNIISFDVDVIGGLGTENMDFILGAGNTDVILVGSSIAFTPNGLSITVNNPNANTVPVINTPSPTSVDEGGSVQIPLSITDADGDNLTVTITTISNEPQELQSNNNGAQTDPYPFDASAFFSESNQVTGAGSYSSSLDFSPTFGDGGSNGDGSGVYTITIQVDDEDGNTVTETFDLTVNDVHQALSAASVTRIEAESYDDQGNIGGGDGIGVEEGSFINIGFTTNNDFAEYLIDVPVAGTYQFDFEVAKSGGTPNTMTINGIPCQAISVNATGGWTNYITQTVNVSLPAGQQTLSLVWTGNSGFFFNIDYFDVSLLVDNSPPAITLLGDDPLDIALNTSYTDPGATASDNLDCNVTANIVVGGDVVDISTQGTYVVTYNVTDAAGNAAPQQSRTVNVLAAVDQSPTITPINDVAVNEGDNINLSITVMDDNTPNATIEIFDKSAGGTVSTSPATSVPTTTISGFTFTGTAGAYTLDWTPGSGEGRSYLARVTADDGVNAPVVEEFTIDVAQQIPGLIFARTFNNPLPWYASSQPQGSFDIAIETNTNQNIGFIDNGEFVEYWVNIPNAGTYDLRVNAGNGSGSPTDVTLSEDNGGLNALGSVTVNVTGWQSYVDYTTPVTFANSGLQTIRLSFNGGVNVKEFELSTPVVGNTAPVVSISSPADLATFFTGDNINFSGTATDAEEGNLSASLSWSSDLDGNIGTGASFSTTSLSAGTHTITASVMDNDGTNPLSGDASISISLNDPAPACNVSFRVNAGGANLVDPNGDFTADQATSTANGTAVTGTPSQYYTSTAVDKTFGVNTALVTNTTGYPDVLFQTERYYDANNPGVMTWEFPTGDGIYDVKILFNENWNNEINNPRVFDIEIEGAIVESNYRPSGPTGADVNIAKVESYQVSVADGTLNVNFIKGTQNPAIKGFDICFVGPLPSAPTAAFTPTPNPAACDQQVSFDGTASTHSSGGSFSIISYEWDFDYDGSTFDVDALGSTTTYTFNASQASFDVALRVTDDQTNPETDIAVITVNLTSAAPTADPGGPYVINLGDDLTLDGTNSSDPDIACGDAIVSYAWELNGDASFNDANGANPTLTAADLSNLGLGVGSTTVDLLVTDNFGNTNTVSTTLQINQTTVALPLCLNSGNQPAVNAFGRSFLDDDPYLVSSGNNFNKPGFAISGTVPGSGEENLFQSEKFGDPLSYEIPTGNGSFTVELYFAELYVGAPGGGSNQGTGDRIFGVDIEGTTLESGIDMFDTYGPLTAFTKTYQITVTDGVLNIDLNAAADNAKLSGICISETANFIANLAPTITIDPVVDLLDCEGDGEDINLSADADDTEQGDMDAVIVWKDDLGTEVGTGSTLALTNLLAGTYTYTAEVTDATPNTTTASVTFNVVANNAPVLSAIVANPGTITAGTSVALSTTASDVEDDDNTLVVSWSSDLESPSALGTGANITATLNTVGTHTITATVTDACGETTTTTASVVVNAVVVNAPVITITTPSPNDQLGRGVLFNVAGTATDVEDGTITGNLSWSLVNGTDPNFTGTGGSFQSLIITPGPHAIQATVTDLDNNTSVETVDVEVLAPVVEITSPNEGGSVPTQNVTLTWTAQNMLLNSSFNEHFHIYVNPPDPNNLDPMSRISTATQIGQLFWNLTATDGIVIGANTIVIVGAEGLHMEFANPEATDIVNFTVLPPGTPVADIQATPNPVDCGTAVSFDGTNSSHTGPFNINSYEWDFDYDGNTFSVDASGSTASHTYNTLGTYTAALRVTDDQNPAVSVIQTESIVVTTSTAPIASAGGPYAITLGDDLVLDGSGSSDPDVACGDAITTYEWELNGDASYDDATGAQPTLTALDLGSLGLGVGTHTVSLRVTDSQGLTNVQDVSLVISAPITDVFFVINPALSNLNENDPLTVIVQVQANTQQIDLAEVHLSFDPTVVQVTGLTPLATGILPSPVVLPVFDNIAGTIDYAAGALSSFPSGTFDFLQIDLVAVGGPSTALDFTFNLPGTTIATFAFQNVLSGTSPATINVTENPELIITPDVFNEALTEGGSTTNTFAVTTSDASNLPGDLTLSDDANSPDWLVINPTNDGYSIDATNLAAGTYTATITATGTGYDDGTATVNLVVSPAGAPAAFVEILPGAGLGSSTFGGSSAFSITNQSTGTVQITSVSIDLSSGLLPDMVFDPTGSGGDATAQCFTAGPTAATVGLVAPTDICVDPFSAPRQGGFDVITVDFTQFDPSEQFSFGVDIDPNSIQGVPGAGAAGSVSGYELVGATVTISFNDGSTIVSSLFEEGSLGGSNVTAATAAPSTPSIAVVGVSPIPATVTDPNQIITVTGTPGDNVTLLQMDSRTYIATGAPPFNVPDVTYYANEAMSGKFLYSATIGGGGTVDIPVVLVQTPGSSGTPDGGINRFLAVSHTGPYGPDIQTSQTSNPVVLKLDAPNGTPAAFIEITPGQGLTASTFGGSSAFNITNQSTGNLQITSVSIDLSTGLMPDMVFDPTGTGGDATAQCFTAGATAATVGLVAPSDICVDPFSAPRQGGFDVITVDFTEFDPSEQFSFGVDIDPNSIQGVPGAGFAGAVSGFELVGATVTVSFNDGSTLTGSLYEEGSLGGANVLVSTAAPSTPSISVVGVSPTPATVNDPNQTFTVTGTPGDNVSLLLMDSRTFIANGAPPFNVPDVTYYANEAMAKVLFTGTIGAGGSVDIPVTLVQTAGASGSPDGGVNRFIAVTHTGAYGPDIQTSQASNPIVLRYDPSAEVAGTIAVPTLCAGRTIELFVYDAGTNVLEFNNTATLDGSGGFVITGISPGTYDLYVKTDGYLQKVSSSVALSSGSNPVSFGTLLAGDIDGDNDVDINDFTLFSAAFLSSTGDNNFNPAADFDCNGQIDINDFSLLSPQFNTLGDQP